MKAKLTIAVETDEDGMAKWTIVRKTTLCRCEREALADGETDAVAPVDTVATDFTGAKHVVEKSKIEETLLTNLRELVALQVDVCARIKGAVLPGMESKP